jgi:hypothetical protein
MHENRKDTQRAREAVKPIIDNRDIATDAAAIMVTVEHVIATVLIALYKDPRVAADMFNEALLPGIEARLAFYASKK